MAINSNFLIGNYGTSAKFIESILPLHLADQSKQEMNLSVCKNKNFQDVLKFPSLCCYETLEEINETFYQCTFCEAKFSITVGQSMNRCIYCQFGSLSHHSNT
jgi:DNA-directed RNA polymerase subunit RPC12/RpoP